MPWQLIHTSSPRGLTSGQSGYCTVARSQDLREGLVSRLEQLSCYEHAVQPGMPVGGASPVIAAYRTLDLRGAKYHVLTRIVDAGLDFTKRTNHLSHHLVFEPGEVTALPSPAAIMALWNGWRSEWREDPRFILPREGSNLHQLPRQFPLPAKTWQRVAGDAGAAAGLLEFSTGCHLKCAPGGEEDLLLLFAETLQLLDPHGLTPGNQWHIPFTTFLQGTDNAADFLWRGCRPGSTEFGRAVSIGNAVDPADIRAPNNELACIARHGRPVVVPRAATAILPGPTDATRPALTLRREPARPPAPVPLRGWSNEEFERTSQESEAEQESSHRKSLVWAAAMFITLMVLAITGWVKPGFLSSRKEGSPTKNDKPIVVPSVAVPPSPNGIAPSNATAPPSTATVAPPPMPRAPPAPKPPPVLTEAARNHLEAQWDDIPTALLVVRGAEPVEFTLGGELESLLEKLLSSSNPVNPADIQCFVQAGPKFLLSGTGAMVIFNPDTTTKRGSIADLFTLDYGAWAAARPSRGRVRIQSRGALSALTAIVFQPAPDKNYAFSPFRLVVLNATARLAPMELHKFFVQPDQGELAASLQTPLREKIFGLQRQLLNSTSFQFDPYKRMGEGTNAPLRSVFYQWESAPAIGDELAFSSHRVRLTAQIADLHAIVSSERVKAANLKRSLDYADDDDFELGAALGIRSKNLHSFSRYCRSGSHPGDRGSFAKYIRQVVEEGVHEGKLKVEPSLITRLGDSSNFEMALAELQTAFGAVSGRSFAAQWHRLASVVDFSEREREKGKLKEELSTAESKAKEAITKAEKLQGRLDQVPKGIEDTDAISLRLLGSDSKLELIRFSGQSSSSP